MSDTVWLCLIIAIMNTIIVSIFSYAIFVAGHSGWWFLLMVGLLSGFKTREDK